MPCEDDLSEHLPLGETLMRPVRTIEGIDFGDRSLESRRLYGRVEALEFANARDAVMTDEGHAAALPWCGLDTVRVC